MDKLSVRGAQRVIFDFASEAMTLGTGGAVVMLALAIPAFNETSEKNWLKTPELAVTFLDRYGQEVGRRGIKHDDSLKLEEFPDHLIKAVLATEDRRFFEHWGIDPIGTSRALTVNARSGGQVVQGGSSLTQQLAKNLFLNNERSLERKVKEAFLALWLEFHLSKNEILKLYLDRAYMGGGNFGAAAAAEYYFGKSVKDITLAEAAMLAGLFKAPTKYAPHVNLPAARARANDVLNNMVESGFLTEGQIQTARRNPATPIDRKREVTPDFYLDWAFDQIQKLVADGKLGQDRVLTVKTPLDSAIQRHTEQTIENILRQYGDQYGVEQAAMVVMDPDGAVRAIVGGRDYGQSQFNRAAGALRQPGSSFKPYVYAAALTYDKYRPNTIVDRLGRLHRQLVPGELHAVVCGLHALVVALAKSINTIPVKMSIEHRPRDRRDPRSARRQDRPDQDRRPRPPHGADHAPERHGLAPHRSGRSVRHRPGGRLRCVRQRRKAGATLRTFDIRNSKGDVIYRRDRDAPEPAQVLSSRVVADMNFMLSKVNEEGTGKRAALEGIRRPAKPARRTITMTPGTSASRATSSPRSGTATTTTARPKR